MKLLNVVPWIVLVVAGCGKDREIIKLQVPKYDEMKNVSEAPEPLKRAAQAVIKLEAFNGGGGTASFISPDGLILTNNHVLGLGIDGSTCAREGCFVNISYDFQIGKKSRTVQVFAEPVQVSAEMDAAIHQLWTDSSKTRKVASPHHLDIEPQTPEQLLGRNINVVGHPLLSVKKWSFGEVYHQHGTWFCATNYVLPGNSGSPYLNDRGNIVGLHHRSSGSNGSITRRDVLYNAIGTASSEFSVLLAAPNRSDLFYSIKQAHTLSDVADNHQAYLMAHTGEALLDDGRKIHPLEVLAQKCDEGLKISHFSSPEQMEKKLGECSKAWSWLNCHSPEDGKGYKTCPVGAEKEKWGERFIKAAQKAHAFNAYRSYAWLVSPWRLEESKQASVQRQREILNDFTKRTAVPLSFELAYYLIDANGSDVTYRGLSVADFIKNYRNHPKYEYHYDWIIEGHAALYDWDAFSPEAFAKAIGAMFDDENLNIASKLDLEKMAYQIGLLK
ncbi:MAG: trypsin-like peptidase domain-containing protein [Deltaproteobacteria bacterium]|nr:trypsin-like peptidase domain-containing protein [Deltaproteobacteria bacterium]